MERPRSHQVSWPSVISHYVCSAATAARDKNSKNCEKIATTQETKYYEWLKIGQYARQKLGSNNEDNISIEDLTRTETKIYKTCAKLMRTKFVYQDQEGVFWLLFEN